MKIVEIINEAPLPPDWDPAEFVNNRTSFKSRLAYALDRAKKIGTGSSRVAMTIEYEGRPTALKIAKNQKGLAQNSVELDVLDDGYAKQIGILIPLIDYDQVNAAPTWIQTEIAQKATEKQLCNLIHCESLSSLVLMAKSILGERVYTNYSPEMYAEKMRQKHKTEEAIEICIEYANALAELQNSFGILLDDFARAANWGLYQGKPVIIDVGFTENVRQQHYSRH